MKMRKKEKKEKSWQEKEKIFWRRCTRTFIFGLVGTIVFGVLVFLFDELIFLPVI